jgi:hypothetical protein
LSQIASLGTLLASGFNAGGSGWGNLILKNLGSTPDLSATGYGSNTPISNLFGGDPLNRTAVDANEFGVTNTEEP